MESSTVNSEFVPHPLIPGGHLQTLAAYFLTGSPIIFKNRDVIVQTQDDDKILCRVSEPDPALHGGPSRVVFLFHGLAGSSESNYMTHAARCFNEAGWVVVRVNQRSAGESLYISKKLYHSDRLQDYEDVFRHFHTFHPHWTHSLFIGYSMSGNMVLKYGATPSFLQPKGIISVCAPLRLKEASLKMNVGFNRTYQFQFINDLLKILKIKRGAEYLRNTQLNFLSTLYDFDQKFVVHEAGVDSVDEYYQKTSSFDYIPKITVPHFLIATEDDPIASIRPYLQLHLNELGKIFRFLQGGHIGFVSSSNYFLPQRSLEGQLLRLAEMTLQ